MILEIKKRSLVLSIFTLLVVISIIFLIKPVGSQFFNQGNYNPYINSGSNPFSDSYSISSYQMNQPGLYSNYYNPSSNYNSIYGSNNYYNQYGINNPYSQYGSSYPGYNYGDNYGLGSSYYNSYSNLYPSSSYGSYPSSSIGYGRYYQPFPSQTYLQGQGIDLYAPFGEEQCGFGQDFLIQVAPLGCNPAVVRSDLLEEQNVPVFCQLAATKLNPLIDVDAIDAMSFTGQYPQEISGVGFHPARAAVRQSLFSNTGFYGSSSSLLNSPVLNNIGYAVIVLKRQESEKDMPDYVSGNLIATLRYDVKNAFGVGNVEYALPQVDDLGWSENYQRYGFWRGRGFLRAEFIEPNSAVISIFVDENHKVDTFNLAVGETSESRYLPGFNCFAKFNVKLVGVGTPETTARLRINDGQSDDMIDIVPGQRFLDDRCRVNYIEKKGFFEFAQITCREDDSTRTYDFIKSPKIQLNINGNPGSYEVGEPLPIATTGLSYVISNIDEDKTTNQLYIELSKSSTIGNGYRKYGSLLTGSNSNLLLGSGNRILKGQSLKIGEIDVNFVDVSAGEDETFGNYEGIGNIGNQDLQFKQYFDNAIQDYERVSSDFANEKYNQGYEQSETYGEVALREASDLARRTGQLTTSRNLLERINNQYPNSLNINEIQSAIKDPLFNSEEETRGVFIDGRLRVITFMGASKPVINEYSSEVFVRKNNLTGTTESFTLGKDESRRLFDSNDYMVLRFMNDISAQIDYYEGVSGEATTQTPKRITLLRNAPLIVGNYTLTLGNVNLKKYAFVKITPEIKNIRSEANLSYTIGIEKRAIELSPAKTQERIDKVNETLKTLSKVSDGLGNVVKVTKAACFATSGFLIGKNLIQNLGGKQIARQTVMNSEGGWTQRCKESLATTGSGYVSMDDCFRQNADKIDGDVSTVQGILETQNQQIKGYKSASGENEGIFGSEYNGKDFNNKYLPTVTSDLSSIPRGTITHPVTNRSINVNDFKDVLTNEGEDKGAFYLEQARDIQLYSRIINSGSASPELKKMAESALYNTASDIKESSNSLAVTSSLEKNLRDIGKDDKFDEYSTNRFAISGNYRGEIAKGSEFISTGGVELGLDSSKDYAYQTVYVNNIPHLVVLDGTDSNYRIDKVFKYEGVDSSGKYKLSKSNIESDVTNKFKNFVKVDANAFNNPYKKPEVRYYETQPYKGLPAVVPFDLNRGWYAATKQTVAAFGNLAAFDDSGRVSSFWICNVGSNGLEEFETGYGDDNCQQINLGTGQPFYQTLGLDEAEAVRIVQAGRNALEQASSQYRSGVRSVVINGRTISVGDPAINIPGVKCQDFMSPKDCQLMFNVCDPVICPSSRCDLGGNYQVPDVIQSGIIGSIALCLPNIREGIAVPICLSGVNAGVQGLESIYQSYNSCLQESLETGRQVGICDEIHSIYMCEFFWRQAAPIAKIGLPKLLGALLGEGSRGGGEYLTVKSAFDNTQNSVDYFTQSYAVNSINAFKARSTDEVGSALCKNFISARYPNNGNFLDNLIEPDSPSQYNAWFDEIPFTSATVPATSQYKVYYHIFAGKDIGKSYTVSLRGASGTSFYGEAGRFVVGTGFIPRGESVDETRDFTAPAGYKEVCVSIDAQEECGFKRVTTSFAVDYLKDKYLEEQGSETGIISERECVSGSPSAYSLVNPNIQEGVDNVINPQLYNYGIVRVCSTDNPGNANDARIGTNAARWKVVGTCGNTNVKCWVDTRSIRENIDIKYLEDGTLDSIDQSYANYLTGEEGFLTEGTADEKISEVTNEPDAKTRISKINEVLDKVIFSNQKAFLLLLRGRSYGELAIQAYGNIIDNLDSNVPATNLPVPDNVGGLNLVSNGNTNPNPNVPVGGYDAAIQEAASLTGTYSSNNNKAFVDGLYSRRLITEEQYKEINGEGFFNFEEDMVYIQRVLEDNRANEIRGRV